MTHQCSAHAKDASIGWALLRQVWDRATQLGVRLAENLDAFADARAAAVLDRELSGLSKAELERRGLPRWRASLHAD